MISVMYQAELRQGYLNDTNHLRQKLQSYFKDPPNNKFG